MKDIFEEIESTKRALIIKDQNEDQEFLEFLYSLSLSETQIHKVLRLASRQWSNAEYLGRLEGFREGLETARLAIIDAVEETKSKKP